MCLSLRVVYLFKTLLFQNTIWTWSKLYPDEEKYISQSAIDAIRAIIDAGHKFAIITGRRRSGFERIASIVPHHYGIIEHGCVVLRGSSYDPDWVIGTNGGKTW